MNVPTLNVSKEQAAKALLDYKQHRGSYDKADWEIERIYRRIAQGKQIISVITAIQQAGLDGAGRPRLAIGRADLPYVDCTILVDELTFSSYPYARAEIKVPFPGQRKYQRPRAITPRIPPQYRPSRKTLGQYWILWEANWIGVPTDPVLLKRISVDAWLVVAAWELTPVELLVLKSHSNG